MPRLSQTDVTKAVASGRDHKLADGNSLSLHVRNGLGTWFYQYREGQSMRTRSLGSAADMSPAAARRAREDFAAERRRGRIPRRGLANAHLPTTEPQAEAPKRMRFADVVDSFIAWKASEWKTRSREPENYGRLKTGALGKMWANEITHKHVETELRTRWGDALANAEKMRVRIGLVIDHAVAKEVRADVPNPARKDLISQLIPAAPSSTPRAALAYKDVPALMGKLIADNSPAARALGFCIMTVTRNKEARLVDWREVVGNELIIPGGRGERSMKEQLEHAMPLSDAAIGLLGERGKGLIFGDLADHALNAKLALHAGEGPTVHGFRTAFTTWARVNGYPFELRELAKAHAAGQPKEDRAKDGNSYERYTRDEQLEALRPMLQAWSDYVIAEKPVTA